MDVKLKQNIFKALINALILIALLTIAYSFATQAKISEIEIELSLAQLTALCLLSITLLLISSLAWKNLLSTRSSHVSYLFALEQTSMMLISKYIPGKVWAIFLRAAMAKRLGFSSQQIISLSVLEQLLSMYVSTIGGSILILSFYYPCVAIVSAAVFFALGYPLFKLAYKLASMLLLAINRRGYLESLSLVDFNLLPKQYLIFSSLYIVLWLIIGLIISIFLSLITPSINLSELLLILGSYMISVTIGYVAFFAPGGIGVREGAFIAITSALITPALALKLSIIIRLWNTLYDLSAGLIGYLNYLKRESRSPT
ncbi:MAG: hypothetical protein ACJAQ6_002615 [Arenicella sp.]|jgi:hypothetical protein